MSMKKEHADVGLTPKQARFVTEYLIDQNATQAALRAGYSKNGARQTAHNMLSKPYIKERIAFALEERNALVVYDAASLLQQNIQILDAAFEQALAEPEPQRIMAYRSMAELVGKHVDVQAWRERIEVDVTDSAETLEKANRRLEDLRAVVDTQ